MFSFLRDREKWEKIRNCDEYKVLRDRLEAEYNSLCKDKETPQLPFSMWFETIKTGERKKFEDLYFLRRKQMSVYALMSLIYPENKVCILKLEDILCEICNEYSWSVPIHLPADRLNERNHIDLFAAETGLYLAEIKYIFNDRLNPLVLERISRELDMRIIKSFKNNTYFFENCKSNWASVCGGAVGIVLLYENPDVYMEVKPRIEKCMSNYLEGIGEDGSVSEGMSYWLYGFGFYCLYNDMLKRYTFNRIDYFQNEKVKKIAGFFSGICMSNSTVYSFSDSSQKLSYDIATLYYLNKIMDVSVPSIECGDLAVWKFSWAIRAFLYYNPDTSKSEVKNGVSFYEKLQCYINRNDKYAFAIKGGHNKEEHNHNDVGSFVIVSDNKQLLCDLGAPVYTAHTMSEKAYDDVIEKSSFGHSVPIINGKGQGYGREYFGTLTVNENNTVKIDFAKAYPVEINKLIRIFELKENEIILSDEFDENVKWQERFVTEFEPVVSEGNIKIECMNILFDETKYTTEVETVNTKTHANADRIVYTITFTPKLSLSKASFKLVFAEETKREGMSSLNF